MPSAAPRQTVARRTFVGAALIAPLAGCGLRFEEDASLPGPKAGPAPDTKPLEQVRSWLVAAMAAAQADVEHRPQAGAAQALHRQQLTRLDATLKGLGAKNLPAVNATAAPTSSPSSKTSKDATKPSSSPAPPSANSSVTTTTGKPDAWTAAESVWATARAADVIARVSATSRPLAMSIAAASVASLAPAHITPQWPSDLTMPRTDGSLLTTLETIVDALEWAGARTPVNERDEITAQATWAYAARSLIQVAMPPGAVPRGLRHRTYRSMSDARDVARRAALGAVSASAAGAKSVHAGNEAAGMLYVWSGAVSLAAAFGEDVRPFPGLSV